MASEYFANQTEHSLLVFLAQALKSSQQCSGELLVKDQSMHMALNLFSGKGVSQGLFKEGPKVETANAYQYKLTKSASSSSAHCPAFLAARWGHMIWVLASEPWVEVGNTFLSLSSEGMEMLGS